MTGETGTGKTTLVPRGDGIAGVADVLGDDPQPVHVGRRGVPHRAARLRPRLARGSSPRRARQRRRAAAARHAREASCDRSSPSTATRSSSSTRRSRLSPQVLDQIRLLTALEQDNRRLVQVVLCGQPALLQTLKTEPMLRAERAHHAPRDAGTARIQRSSRVHPASPGHRRRQHSVTFDPDATRVVANSRAALPRRVNVLCDRALQEGRIEGVTVITPDLVKRAARSVRPVANRAMIGAGRAGGDRRIDTGTIVRAGIGQRAGEPSAVATRRSGRDDRGACWAAGYAVYAWSAMFGSRRAGCTTRRAPR